MNNYRESLQERTLGTHPEKGGGNRCAGQAMQSNYPSKRNERKRTSPEEEGPEKELGWGLK